MRILCVSDAHAEEQTLEFLKEFLKKEECDAVIAAGDTTSDGPLGFAEDFLEIVENAGKKIIALHGNYDSLEVKKLLDERKINLHAKALLLDDFVLVGCGGSTPTPSPTPITYSEEKIESFLRSAYEEAERIGKGKKIIQITHNPPYNTIADVLPNGMHVGSKAVRKFIEEKKPMVALCGHIHEAEGVQMLGETKILKIAPLMHGKAAILELPSLETKMLKI